MNRVNKTKQNPFFFVISSRATLNETLAAKNNDILLKTQVWVWSLTKK